MPDASGSSRSSTTQSTPASNGFASAMGRNDGQHDRRLDLLQQLADEERVPSVVLDEEHAYLASAAGVHPCDPAVTALATASRVCPGGPLGQIPVRWPFR